MLIGISIVCIELVGVAKFDNLTLARLERTRCTRCGSDTDNCRLPLLCVYTRKTYKWAILESAKCTAPNAINFDSV